MFILSNILLCFTIVSIIFDIFFYLVTDIIFYLKLNNILFSLYLNTNIDFFCSNIFLKYKILKDSLYS